MIVLNDVGVSKFLSDNNRCRALRFLKGRATVASDAVPCVMMNEQIIIEANFHGAEGRRDVHRWDPGLLQNLFYCLFTWFL